MPKKRADGLYAKQITYIVNGKALKKRFYYKNDKDLINKIKAFEGQLNEQESHPFNIVADEWEENHFKTIQDGTKICYSPALKRAKEYFGDEPIKNIRPLDIQRLVDTLANKKYSQQTVRVQRNVLNLIFKFAVLQDYIEQNPVEPTRVPRHLNKTKRTVPSDEDISVVLNSTDKEFGLFPYFLLLTGLRRGELLALQWRDIEGNTAHIYKQVTYNGDNQNQPHLTEHTKTEAGQRDVFLPDALLEKLQRGKPTEYIFGGERPLTKIALRRKWDKYVEQTGINLTPHQLRHTYATFLYESNVPEKEAQTILGHSSVKVTQDVYTHIRENRKKQTEEKINDYISKLK